MVGVVPVDGWLSQVGCYRLSAKDWGPDNWRLIAIGYTGIHSAFYLGKAAYFRKNIPGDQIFCLFSCWCSQGLIFDQIHTDEEPRAPEGGDIFTAMVFASLSPGLSHPFSTLEIDGVGWRKLGIFRIPVPSREWM